MARVHTCPAMLILWMALLPIATSVAFELVRWAIWRCGIDTQVGLFWKIAHSAPTRSKYGDVGASETCIAARTRIGFVLEIRERVSPQPELADDVHVLNQLGRRMAAPCVP
jgi:hypothetical protein